MSAEVEAPPSVTNGGTTGRTGKRRRPTGETVRVYVLRGLLIVVIIGGWQAMGSRSPHNQLFYSKPSDIWSSLRHLLVSGPFYVALRYTMYETVIGFLIGGVAG